MNKRININTISKDAICSDFLPFEQNKRASLLNCRLAFYVHRESLRILPKLIISNLNQRLTTQPNDLLNIQSCANLRVLTGTAFYFIVCLIMVLLQGVI